MQDPSAGNEHTSLPDQLPQTPSQGSYSPLHERYGHMPPVHQPYQPQQTYQPSHQPVPEQLQSSPADSTPGAHSSRPRVGVVLVLILLAVVFGPRLFARSSSGSTPSSQSGSNSPYPQLKTFYYGSYIECSGDMCAPGGLSIYVSSEDQQGAVNLTVYYTYSTSQCSGNVTTDGQMTLHCSYISVTGDAFTSTFHGTVYSDGHIEGTDTTDNPPGGTTHYNKWNVS